jgi:2-aminoadipate transaminase
VTDLPIAQYVPDDAVLNLGWGYPSPGLLPVREWAAAVEQALASYGWQALAYGRNPGPGPMLDWLCARLGVIDGRAPELAEVFVTAGASHALELTCGALTAPGDTVLVDSPTYHLALRLIADHGVRIVGVPADESGLDPVGTAALLDRLRAEGRRVPLLYLVPTYGNPTGRSLPPDRRAALVELAARTGLVIVEDDTYRELSYPPAVAPPSLWSQAPPGSVVRLGSFAKSVAPGLRLGFLTGAAAFVRALAERGVVDSGGGVNHTTAMSMVGFGDSGAYDRHLRVARAAYAARRDALAGAVRGLPVRFEVPEGGWFLWLSLPDHAPVERLLDIAPRHGVAFLPGTRSYAAADDGRYRARVSFSLYAPDELVEAARRLGSALRAL